MEEQAKVTASSDFHNLELNTGAVILAGGLGQRLRAVGLKPFLLHDGKSFLQIVLDNAAAIGLRSVVVVTNRYFYRRIAALLPDSQILLNPHPEQGMLSSVIIGLRAIENSCSGAFLCPIDYPLVQPATYRKLLQAHRCYPNNIIQPVFNARGGHPIILPRNMFPAVTTESLEEGIRSLVQKYAQVKKLIVVDDPGILININTPESYYQYCR